MSFWKETAALLGLGAVLCIVFSYVMTRYSVPDGPLSGVLGIVLLCVMATTLLGAEALLQYVRRRKR